MFMFELPFLGKLTISMAMFNSYVIHYQNGVAELMGASGMTPPQEALNRFVQEFFITDPIRQTYKNWLVVDLPL